MSGEELRALAEGATPGPWGWGGAGVGTDYWDGREELPIARTDWTEERGLTREWMDRNRDNGQFIAAANPTAVLALLDERDALRAQVERVAKVLDQMVRQMHALDLGDDETQSKLDGWAAGIGGAAIVLRAALDGPQ